MTQEYTGTNRRAIDSSAHDCPAMAEFDARLKNGAERIRCLEAKIDSNSADTREVLSILHAGRGFFKVVGWIGNLVKYCALVGAPVVAFWYTIKHGGKP